VRNEFIAELPEVILQVLARGEGGEESDGGFHRNGSIISVRAGEASLTL